MIEFLKKIKWQERAISTEKYQKEYDLSLRQMADEFETSKSQVGRDLTLAAALRVFPQLEKMSYTEALAFIKKKNFVK